MAEAIAAAILWVSTHAAFVYFVVTVAVSIYGSSQARRAAADAAEQARQEFNAGLKERTITRIATDASFRYVYGRARVGSNIVAMFTSGDKDQYKHLVCVHADHECEAYEAIFINGNELGTLDADGWVTAGDKYWSARTESVTENFSGLTYTLKHPPIAGTVQCYDYVSIGDGAGMMSWQPTPFTISTGNVVTLTTPATTPKVVYKWLTGIPRVNVKKHLGTPADTADAYLMSVVPDKWKDTAVLRGKCYSVVTLDLNEAEFQGGIVPIEVLLKGKKIYDVRDGVTRWSDNPALAVYDYLTSPLCNVPAADLPVSSFITAANVCDETSTSVVNFGNTLGGVAGISTSLLNKAYAALAANKQYTINGTVTSDQDKSKVLEMMTQCMAGGLVSTTWDIWAGKYVAPVAALYQEDIVGAVAITPGISDADIFNGVKGQYIDPMNMYVATDYEPFQNATYLAVDGRDLFNSIDFPFSDNAQRVHNLCRIFTEDHRNSYTIKANFSLKAWPLKVGQRVTFTSSFFGQTAKVFRITDKTFSPESMVELTLKEDDPSIWDDADALTPEATLNTNLQNPFAIAPITGLTASSGSDSLLLQADGTVVSRVHLVWNATTTQAVSTNGLIEIEWQQIGSDVWQKLQVSGNEVSAYISDVQDGRYYTIRARTVNPYLNVKSDWSYLTHQVIGKTEPPPDIASITYNSASNVLSWSSVSVLDLAGYEVRYTLGAGSWATAAVVTSTLKSVTNISPTLATQHSVTFYVKAVDNSGNYSTNAATVVASLVPPDIQNFSINGTVLNWSSVQVTDLAGYAFRFNYGNNSDWGSAVPLHTGLITQSPFDLVTKPSGVVTIMGKAVDLYGNESNATANIVTDLGDPFVANVVETFTFSPTFSGTISGASVTGGNLVASNLDSFFGTDNQSFFGEDNDSFYEPAAFSQIVYTTDEFTITKALAGSKATLNLATQGDGLFIEYRLAAPTSFYGADSDSFYGVDSDSMYDAPGPWIPWPGSITVANDIYQIRVTIGAGTVQGIISSLSFIVDAPDIVESKQDLVVSASGTTIPYTSSFTAIKNIQATLQANASGAVTVEIDKTLPLAPVIRAYNASHVAVSGATVDITLKGY